MEKQQAKRQLWIEEEEKKDEDANYKFRTTNENFEKYAEVHPEEKDTLEEPNFHNYYSPSKDKKNGELLFTVLSVSGLSYVIYKFV